MTGAVNRINPALEFILSSDHETWVRFGMTIKSDLGDAWSQQDDSYNSLVEYRIHPRLRTRKRRYSALRKSGSASIQFELEATGSGRRVST